ncbi:MAG: archaetidylserine decarboxylase, partial [Pseudomonadota bacterium]
ADGRVSAAGRIDGGTLIQAKGHQYEVSALLQDEGLAARFAGGSFATVYLAPSDYHRVHWPCSGALRGHWPIDGRLFAVNGATAAVIPQLFARNARHVFHVDGQHSDIAMVMVGALNVASITIPWREQGLERCERGDIAAWFNMGSTVILLLPEGWTLAADIAAGATVRVGQRLAHWQEAADA